MSSMSALTTITKEDEVSLLPFKQVNYARDETVAAWIRKNLIDLASFVRSDRSALEETWAEIRRLVLLQHDTNQKYIGRSKVYVPSYLQARTTMVSAISRGLFPSDDYMDVKIRKEGKLEAAAGAKNYIKYEWDKVARLRTAMKPFASQFIDYGLSFAKAWYEKPKKLTKARLGQGQDRMPSIKMYKNAREGLRFSPRSVFFTYVWPTTIDSLDEAELVFEDIDISRLQLEALGKNGFLIDVEKVSLERNADHDSSLQQQQMETQLTSTTGMDVPVADKFGATVTVTEAWLCLPLPASAYEGDETVGEPVPARVIFAGDVILSVTRNPFWHQSPPYLMHRMRTFPGSLYPQGVGHATRFLQYLVNDFTNQLNDNGTYALNPMAKVNIELLQGPLPGFRPGVVIPVRDPKAIEFDRPPVEQLHYGQMLVQMYMSMLQDTSGAPAILQGVGGSKGGAKTATGSQILQGNALNPLQDMTEDMEVNVMVPLMEMTMGYGNQFRTEDVLDELAGEQINVGLKDIAGDFVYTYLASSQAANQQQRAQQAMTLLQILPSVQPLLIQNQKMADPEPLLKRLFSDGFGFRGFDEFIKPVSPQAMQPGMPGAPEPQEEPEGEAAEVEGNGGDSAIPESMSSVQGEGNAFASVRDGADAMAAAAGAAQQGAVPESPLGDVD